MATNSLRSLSGVDTVKTIDAIATRRAVDRRAYGLQHPTDDADAARTWRWLVTDVKFKSW